MGLFQSKPYKYSKIHESQNYYDDIVIDPIRADMAKLIDFAVDDIMLEHPQHRCKFATSGISTIFFDCIRYIHPEDYGLIMYLIESFRKRGYYKSFIESVELMKTTLYAGGFLDDTKVIKICNSILTCDVQKKRL